jgi:hypothetical protein
VVGVTVGDEKRVTVAELPEETLDECEDPVHLPGIRPYR